ncbi:electron transport complex subunit RsxC [Uliginosibacterium aquaticum]|uniref:Ion-translocating oxidoreductase complex subunit C n=1 Tax=Uliginosibacterium aquaticum TaxID=2731212 RepID=A0ABX2IGA2_9RHOO|nr:electron transport complex subunit RsxC [Uliginosibacterium aquaticum]NSL54883.1 electron transport complex subunit RsxC [Uliginosibacterium aquaticum]
MPTIVIPPLRRLLQRWGVHPDSHKYPAAGLDIEDAGLPDMLRLPLSQHVGAPAKVIVEVGERVLRGQLIASTGGKISAPLHAPTSGTIVAIDEAVVPHPAALTDVAIHLRPDGLDEWIPLKSELYPINLSEREISDRVEDAGIVGMGGASFPSAVKLSLGHRSKVTTLMLNGSECEPYLSCDDRLMQENAHAIIEGARLILKATGATRVLAGIEDNKPEAILAMKLAAKPFPEVHIVKIPSRYPMGADRQLIKMLTGIEAPADGRAADVGVLVHNVGTAYAVYRALRYGEPLTERVVTVAGGAVSAPRNLRVRLGTPMAYLFERCGGLRVPPARVVSGGPMMGIGVQNLDTPVVKGTSGVLALAAAEVGEREASACIRCGSCVEACPVGLLPLEMAARIHANALGEAEEIGLDDCLTCGACGFICPSRIPLVQYFQHAKGELASRSREQKRLDTIKELTEAKAARIEREAREKAEIHARRKAERERAQAAEAAAKAARAAEKETEA